MNPSLPLLHLGATLPVLLGLVACSQAYKERGLASYIADQYAGKLTSSGQPYQPYGWTAAHYTLPYGTQVKVKNNRNGRAVNLIINDRFPHYPGRVINVSRAAADYLQIPPYQMVDVTVTAKKLPAGGQLPVHAAYTAQPPPPAPASYPAVPQLTPPQTFTPPPPPPSLPPLPPAQ